MPKFIEINDSFFNCEQIKNINFRNLEDGCAISLSLIPVPFNTTNEILLEEKNFIVTKEVAEKIREQLRDC